jgi:hypothetical protein
MTDEIKCLCPECKQPTDNHECKECGIRVRLCEYCDAPIEFKAPPDIMRRLAHQILERHAVHGPPEFPHEKAKQKYYEQLEAMKRYVD